MQDIQGGNVESRPQGRSPLDTQDKVVQLQLLTKSNRITFQCLKLFFTKDRPERRLKELFRKSPVSNAYDMMKGRAKAYLRIVDASLVVTSTGICIAKMVIAVLESSECLPAGTIQELKKSATESRHNAHSMWGELRGLRQDTMSVRRELNPSYNLDQVSEVDFIETNGVKAMSDEDFFAFTTQVIDQFLATIGQFIQWWADLMATLQSIEQQVGMLQAGTDVYRKTLADLWKDIESEYRTYTTDVTAQQDWYGPELRELIRKKRLFGLGW